MQVVPDQTGVALFDVAQDTHAVPFQIGVSELYASQLTQSPSVPIKSSKTGLPEPSLSTQVMHSSRVAAPIAWVTGRSAGH